MSLLPLLVLATVCWAMQKPPPPSIDAMESVLMEQYVMLVDRGSATMISPQLLEVMGDISRRHSAGCRTTQHYEMHTGLFRYLLRANSYLPVENNLEDPLAYLDKECEAAPTVVDTLGEHRLVMMRVIGQQFARLVETNDLESDASRRLIDMTFHLAQWHMTPECDQPSDLSQNITHILIVDYYSAENRRSAIVALYNLVNLAQSV